MPTPPIPAQDAEPLTAAVRDLQERLFEISLSWEEHAARATYACADAALDVARQLLAGTLVCIAVAALETVLGDKTPLPERWLSSLAPAGSRVPATSQRPSLVDGKICATLNQAHTIVRVT